MNKTLKTDNQNIEYIAAQLECLNLRHAAEIIRELARQRDIYQKLTGYYRYADENERKRETAMAAAIGAGYCGHLRGPEAQ